MFLVSPTDDAPTPLNQAPSLTLARLHREQDSLHMQSGNVRRMLEARRAEDPSYTLAVVRMTLAAARNTAEAFLRTLDEVEAEVLPVRPLPVAKPFGRRSADAALPAVVSPARV
ncbi:hypothetical protein MKK88_00315 [Methylobacterium sp. E-005]|uniref:hypothetical protein n=1 Tax=Methylobacterium sp. E-005 TaxID=2836549 RepID=UPI001FB87262|nr:hypothetical protein [Methylobacterium sp. E-005]MCJ2084439.1 hypothetical protein [Methylobacterium sp. E-005]